MITKGVQITQRRKQEVFSLGNIWNPFTPVRTKRKHEYMQGNVRMRIYTSYARVSARNFQKINVLFYYYHMSLGLKYHRDSSFGYGDRVAKSFFLSGNPIFNRKMSVSCNCQILSQYEALKQTKTCISLIYSHLLLNCVIN